MLAKMGSARMGRVGPGLRTRTGFEAGTSSSSLTSARQLGIHNTLTSLLSASRARASASQLPRCRQFWLAQSVAALLRPKAPSTSNRSPAPSLFRWLVLPVCSVIPEGSAACNNATPPSHPLRLPALAARPGLHRRCAEDVLPPARPVRCQGQHCHRVQGGGHWAVSHATDMLP